MVVRHIRIAELKGLSFLITSDSITPYVSYLQILSRLCSDIWVLPAKLIPAWKQSMQRYNEGRYSTPGIGEWNHSAWNVPVALHFEYRSRRAIIVIIEHICCSWKHAQSWWIAVACCITCDVLFSFFKNPGIAYWRIPGSWSEELEIPILRTAA